MHRTDAIDHTLDIGNGNRGFKDTPPGNETFVVSNFMNAVQEEISEVIELAGLTLRVSGATDTAAQWGQLAQAIQILIDQKGVIANAVSFGLVTTPGQGTANTTALNDAFNSSKLVYIPAGDYEINGAPTIPDGAVLMGDNGLSKLTAKGHSTWALGDKNVRIIGINFDHNGTFSNTITLPHTTQKFTILENCIFTGGGYTPIFIASNNNGVGVLKIINCHFNNVNRAIEINVGGSAKPRMIITENLFTTSTIAHFEAAAEGFSIYKNNSFVGCTFNIDDKNTLFESNEFDGTTTWEFNATNSCIIRNNIFNTTPIVNPSNDPRFFFINNTDREGRILVAEESINGALVNYKRNSNIVIVPAASQAIPWDQKIVEKMAFHNDYGRDDVYDHLTGLFTVRGLSKGTTRITSQVMMNEANDIDVLTYLRINGTKTYVFSKSNVGVSTGVHSIDVEIKLNDGDTFDVFVDNFSTSNATILQIITGLESFIKVEGL